MGLPGPPGARETVGTPPAWYPTGLVSHRISIRPSPGSSVQGARPSLGDAQIPIDWPALNAPKAARWRYMFADVSSARHGASKTRLRRDDCPSLIQIKDATVDLTNALMGESP